MPTRARKVWPSSETGSSSATARADVARLERADRDPVDRHRDHLDLAARAVARSRARRRSAMPARCASSPGQRDDRGAGIDQEADAGAVDLRLGVEMAVRRARRARAAKPLPAAVAGGAGGARRRRAAAAAPSGESGASSTIGASKATPIRISAGQNEVAAGGHGRDSRPAVAKGRVNAPGNERRPPKPQASTGAGRLSWPNSTSSAGGAGPPLWTAAGRDLRAVSGRVGVAGWNG